MLHIENKPTVVVISSHVARGSVGNRAAVFALERLGFPVVAVPTVTLTWHPGQGAATRIVPSDEAFAALVDDIAGAKWLPSVGGVLSGYLGSAGQALAIAALVQSLKQVQPRALYACDPVIGDADGRYVADDVVTAIQAELLPIADIATPNRYELGFLEGVAPSDNDRLVGMARSTGIDEVVVTSALAPTGQAANVLVTADRVRYATHPASPVAPHGTGDLFSALYLARRLGGRSAGDALRLAAGATLRLVEAADGGDDLPLAARQSAFLEVHEGVAITEIE